jgi:hypothetical protein
MARVAARVSDKRVRKLIRAFLKAGVMEGGLVSPVEETVSSEPVSGATRAWRGITNKKFGTTPRTKIRSVAS